MAMLTKTKRAVLVAAADRNDRLVLPVPTSLKLSKSGETRILNGLIRKHLVAARPAKPNEPDWHGASDGARQTLVITNTGLQAIGVKVKGTAKRPSKVDAILVLLQRPSGATIDALMADTGWQAHSVRAALSGLRKRDIAVTRDRQDGVTHYRVEAT